MHLNNGSDDFLRKAKFNHNPIKIGECKYHLLVILSGQTKRVFGKRAESLFKVFCISL